MRSTVGASLAILLALGATIVGTVASAGAVSYEPESGPPSYPVSQAPSPSPTPSATSTPVVTPSPSPSITPSPTPTPTPTPKPTVTPAPAPSATTPPPPVFTWSFQIGGIDLSNLHPGDHFVISGHDIPAGAVVTAELHSRVVTLGRTTVGATGRFALGATIPLDTPVGLHHIVVALQGAGLTSTSSQAVTVRALDVAPAVVAPVAAAGTGPQLETHSYDPPVAKTDSAVKKKTATAVVEPAIQPNILTRSINPIQDVITHPQKITAAIEIGLVLLVFATLPARLLNATIAEQYSRITKRVPRLARKPLWYERFTSWMRRTPVAGGILISAAAALLFGFADPRFGFTLASVRLILGLGVALFIVEYVANAITGRVVRRRWSVNVMINLRPLGLILTLIGVVLSRALHFSPGFLVGVVLGITLSGRRAGENAWKAVMVRTGVVLGLGLVAWLGYSALTTGEPGRETFWTDLFVETLVAITTEGIVAILVELLPFRLLEGERVFHRSRLLWAVTYLVVLVAFVLAVVPWEGNWEQLGSTLWVWLGLVVGFAVFCVAIYSYFRFLSPARETEAEEQTDPVEVGAGG